MSIPPTVSFFGQSTAQINRLKDLNTTLADLQRQITTGKKFDTLAGFGGTAAQTVQRVRMDRDRVHGYLDNIGTINTRIKEMDLAMTSVRSQAKQLIEGLATAIHSSSDDVGTLSTLARQGLAFVQDLANLNVDGRYLFAGSDVSDAPYLDSNALDTNFQAEIANWLSGASTTAQFEANVDSFSAASIGFNPVLSSAGPVTARIDDNTDLDYTVRADQAGFQEIIRALGLMANLKVPDPAVDVPTNTDLDDVLDKILSTVRAGVDKLDQAQTSLGIKAKFMQGIQENNEADAATLEGVITETENADVTEAITKLQALQTQLQASYQVTNVLSQLSLVNFL